jgi:hypothetical protein
MEYGAFFPFHNFNSSGFNDVGKVARCRFGKLGAQVAHTYEHERILL